MGREIGLARHVTGVINAGPAGKQHNLLSANNGAEGEMGNQSVCDVAAILKQH